MTVNEWQPDNNRAQLIYDFVNSQRAEWRLYPDIWANELAQKLDEVSWAKANPDLARGLAILTVDEMISINKEVWKYDTDKVKVARGEASWNILKRSLLSLYLSTVGIRTAYLFARLSPSQSRFHVAAAELFTVWTIEVAQFARIREKVKHD